MRGGKCISIRFFAFGSVSTGKHRFRLWRNWFSVRSTRFQRFVSLGFETTTLARLHDSKPTATTCLRRCENARPLILPFSRFRTDSLQSMILDEDHLYILCGTNSWVYNTDVYDVHLPTLTSTKIGDTFDEIEDPSETGRSATEKRDMKNPFVHHRPSLFRYRQEAFLNNRKIFVFGGGGVSGISYSLENVRLPKDRVEARRSLFAVFVSVTRL